MQQQSRGAGCALLRLSAWGPIVPAALLSGVMSVGLGGALGGCRVARPTVADTVRAENADLKARMALLHAENAELRGKLEDKFGAALDVADAIPVVASIEIDSFSGVRPLQPGATTRRVAAYIRPLDGRMRFVQAVGDLRVEVRDEAGSVIASRELGPGALREAYRSQFAGTYYAVEFDVAARTLQAPARVEILATLTDRLTGTQHEASRGFAINDDAGVR